MCCIWLKAWNHDFIHQRKCMGNRVMGGRPYEEQKGKGGNCDFLYWIYYNRLFFMWMCVLIEWN
jgi:hypothetical protein